MGHVKMACFISCYILTWLRMYRSCSEGEFAEFEKIVLMQTLKGHRLAAKEADFFDHDVFSKLQCLDLCLRTEDCASVDFKETCPRNICRINRATKSRMRFLEDENWSHLNISAQDLGQVSPKI